MRFKFNLPLYLATRLRRCSGVVPAVMFDITMRGKVLVVKGRQQRSRQLLAMHFGMSSSFGMCLLPAKFAKQQRWPLGTFRVAPSC